MGEVVFHIIGRRDWEVASAGSHYAPDSLASEGFLHLSRRAQILRPANLLYRGRDDLVLLVIDPAALDAELVYEPGSHGEDELFPHLYGPLRVAAVQGVVEFPCRSDGTFELPGELAVGDE